MSTPGARLTSGRRWWWTTPGSWSRSTWPADRRPCGAPVDGSPLDRSLSYEERTGIPWRLAAGAWFGSSCLQLQRVGEPRSWWRWLDGSGWYVNLQDPLRRTRIGFDTSDHVLDLVVAPDGSWCWKDEDELEAACRVGRFTRKEAAAVRRAGEAAVAAVEARSWPFDSEWSDWQPNASWTVPALPADMSGL